MTAPVSSQQWRLRLAVSSGGTPFPQVSNSGTPFPQVSSAGTPFPQVRSGGS
ncbi:hypothetical protein AVEN_93791-1, partial [Araneus ventricosus]